MDGQFDIYIHILTYRIFIKNVWKNGWITREMIKNVKIYQCAANLFP